jgi:uncharacterized membrane protein YdjX (TVP38/TMEM64 family)
MDEARQSGGARAGKGRFLAVWGVLAVLVLVPFFLYADAVEAWMKSALALAEAHPWRVAAVLLLLLAGDIFLPVPSCLASALCGALLGPWCGFLVSFSAMTLGAATGYFLGFFSANLSRRLLDPGVPVLRDGRRRWGGVVLLMCRPVPVLAECSVVYAGLERWPFSKCWPYVAGGNAVVSATYVLLGHAGRAGDSPLPAFLAVLFLSGGAWLSGRFFLKHS